MSRGLHLLGADSEDTRRIRHDLGQNSDADTGGGGGKVVLGLLAVGAIVVVGGGIWFAKIWLAGKALKVSGVIK